jgi:hypothetical protein
LIFVFLWKMIYRLKAAPTLAKMIADGTTTPAAGAVSVQECAGFATIPPDQLGSLLALANTPGSCAALAAALETAGVTTASVFLDEVSATKVVQRVLEYWKVSTVHEMSVGFQTSWVGCVGSRGCCC